MAFEIRGLGGVGGRQRGPWTRRASRRARARDSWPRYRSVTRALGSGTRHSRLAQRLGAVAERQGEPGITQTRTNAPWQCARTVLWPRGADRFVQAFESVQHPARCVPYALSLHAQTGFVFVGRKSRRLSAWREESEVKMTPARPRFHFV